MTENKIHTCIPDTNGSDNSIPMAYLTLDHQLQVKEYCTFSVSVYFFLGKSLENLSLKLMIVFLSIYVLSLLNLYKIKLK